VDDVVARPNLRQGFLAQQAPALWRLLEHFTNCAVTIGFHTRERTIERDKLRVKGDRLIHFSPKYFHKEIMKRDFSLIRNILMTVEDAQPGEVIQNFQHDGSDARTVAEHVRLLQEADFIEADFASQLGSSEFFYAVTRLTWKGHEFLANAKNDTLWKKVIAQAQEKGTSVSLSVLDSMLSAAAKKYLGIE
jgi:Hypothetical protein (DUF2513)